jgi:hypothetical protein
VARAKLNPTPEQRALVRRLSGCGLTHEEICVHMGINSIKTLWAWYRDELTKGRVYAAIEVYKANFELAISGKNPSMTIHWLKTFAGWGPNMQFEPAKKGEGNRMIWEYTVRRRPEGWVPPILESELVQADDPL